MADDVVVSDEATEETVAAGFEDEFLQLQTLVKQERQMIEP